MNTIIQTDNFEIRRRQLKRTVLMANNDGFIPIYM